MSRFLTYHTKHALLVKCIAFMCLFLGYFTAFSQDYRWAVSAGDVGNERSRRVAVDSNGVYVLGDFSSITVDFDTTAAGIQQVVGNLPDPDYYIAKFDTTGAIIWASEIVTEREILAFDFQVEPNGFVIVGLSDTTTDFDPVTGNVIPSMVQKGFIARYIESSVTDSLDVVRQIDSATISGITKDIDGNYYVCGSFVGEKDFGLLTTSFLMSDDSGSAFVMKLNPNLELIWVNNYGPALTDNREEMEIVYNPNSQQIHLAGSFTVSGNFNPNQSGANPLFTSGQRDGFVLTLDTSGAFVNNIQLASDVTGAVKINNLEVDLMGNLYLCGHFTGTMDADFSGAGFNLVSAGGKDGFFAKYNSNGVFTFAESLGSPQDENVSNIRIDPTGAIYLSGDQAGTVDFNLGVGTNLVNATNVGTAMGFMARYSSNLDLEWVNSLVSLDSTLASHFDLDGDGNIYLAGSFVDDIDLDPTANIQLRTSNGQSDMFIARYDNCVTAYILQQPDSMEVCTGTASNFGLVAGGTDTANFQYQWQLFDPGGPAWNDLTNTGVYANVTQSNFNIADVTGLDGSRYRCLVQGTCFPNDTVFSDVALLTVLTDTILSGTVWNSDTSIGLGGIQVDALDTLGTSLFSGSVASTDPNGSYEIPVTDDPAFLWANVTPVFPNLLPTYWGDTFLVQGASSILYNSCRISGLDIHCDTILFSTSIGSGSGGGYVSQTQGSGKQNGLVPIEDLNILLVDESDSVITSERTDADGYFYFDSLELGKDYFLWADYPFVNFDSVPQLLVLDSLEAFREQVYFLDEGIILRFLYTDISVEELSDDWPLKLFPNPSLGHLYVEGLDESATFQLFDLQGNVRMEAPIYPGNRTIQLPEGLSGFYLIEVRTQHRVKQFRVLLL